MTTITTIPLSQMIPPVNRGQIIANRGAHFETLSDNEFEEFTYWLYKTEITDGSWKGTYDEIRLIQASSDKGRDCALYKNGKLGGVMQCKHSVNPTNMLAESTFAKEVIKFGLYAIVFRKELPLFADFPYYIVTNTGFKEACEDFIDDFRVQIENYANLEKYANVVIGEYASLKGLVYKTIAQDLKDNLKKLAIKKISNAELQRVLSKPYQVETQKNFFQPMLVVDETLLKPMDSRLTNIEQQVGSLTSPPPPARPEPLIFEDVYLPRFAHTTDNDFFTYMLGSQQTLEDHLKKHRHLALIGWGQTGKSTTLKKLASKLSDAEHEDHVFFIHLDDYTDKDIKDFIDRIDQRSTEQLLVILDGLDEVLPQFYGTAVNKIKAFHRDYPSIRTVVSCRENFYSVYDAESEKNTLPHFVSLRLQDLDDETINTYLATIDNFDISTFLRKLREAELEELIRIPFYLLKFAGAFHKTGRIIDGKSALFNALFEEGVIEAVKKVYPKEEQIYVPVLSGILERLAFIMEVQAKNFFTLADLSQIENQSNIELLQQAGKIIYGSAENGGQWRFVHHHMQEYLAARILARQPADFINEVITRDQNHKIIRPSWAHTISFLISIPGLDLHLRHEILDLLLINEPGLIMQFEPENLNKEIRHTIFKTLLENASAQDKRLHRSKFEPAKLARFSQTENNIRYVTDQLANPGSDIQLINLLEVAGFYHLATFPLLRQNLRTAIEGHLDNSNEYIQFLALRALIQLFKLNTAEYQALFVRFQFAMDSHIRFILFHSIWQQGYTENYLPYALGQMRLIMLEEKQSYQNSISHTSRLGQEGYELLNVVKDAKTETAALAMVTFWGNNLSLISHTITFREFRKHLFVLAEKLQSAAVFGQVTGYFIPTLREFAGNYGFEELASYIYSTGKSFEVSKLIYESKKPAGWEHFMLIAQLFDQSGFDFFKSEVIAGNLTAGQAQMLLNHLTDKAPAWGAKWNTLIVQHYPLATSVQIDHEANRLAEAGRKAAALFDKEIFKNEVRNLYTAVGKDSMRYDDLHVLDPKDRVNYHVFYWLFSNLERNLNVTAEYNLSGVLRDVDQISEISWMSRIYLFLKEQKNVVLNASQFQLIKNWVDRQMQTLDFKENFGFMSDAGGVEPELDPMLLCSFFLRHFQMKEYAKEKYLDLLSTHRYNDQEMDVFTFVLSVCRADEVTERVFDNLATNKLKYQVLVNHVQYLLANELTDGADLLIPYLGNQETYEWLNQLNAFRKLGGDLSKLQPLVDQLTGYEQSSLISAFMETDILFIRGWLNKQLAAAQEPKEKLRIAKHLIKLQERSGLETYLEFIRNEKKVPDHSAPGNPLYSARDINLLDKALEIYQFAYEGEYICDTISDLRSIATQMLNGIAFTGNNFPAFQIAFKLFMDEKRMEQPQPDKNRSLLLDQAKYWFEGVEHQYYLQDETPISLTEAIALTKRLV